MSSTLTRPESGSARPEASGERELRQRLAALRRRLVFTAVCRGGGWVVACILLTILVVGLIDYRMHLPGLVRAVALVGLVAGVGVLIYRYLMRPLGQPTDDLSLALRVEDCYPMLNDALASTVQFLDSPDGSVSAGDSASMRRKAIRRTLGRISGMDFDRVVDSKGTRSALLAALIGLTLALPATIIWPALAWTAAARLASPFSSIDYPKKTQIELLDVVNRIGKGREYRLAGMVKGVVPREVTVEIVHEGFPVQRKTYPVNSEDHFAMHLRPEEVQKNFRFRVLANDAVTPEVAVEVLALPRLVSVSGKQSPRIRVDVPSYTDLPSPQNLPPGFGNLDVVAGSVVTFRAAVDRPVKRAWIRYQPELAGTLQAAMLSPLGIPDPLSAVGSLLLATGIYQGIPARLAPDGMSFEVIFRPAVHGTYSVGFEDENRLENSQSFELRLRLDPAPSVRLERPSASRDALNVLPNAALPLHAVIEDPTFAVRSAWLEYRTQAEEMPRRLPLFDAVQGMSRDLAPWAGIAALATMPPRLRLPKLEFVKTISLGQIRHADGTTLKAGDTITLQVKADDFDNISVGKLPGESHQVTIHVVSREAFAAEVNREQARIQKELVTLRDRQRDALEKVRQAEQRVREGGKLSPEREATEAEAEALKALQEATAEQEKAEKAPSEEMRLQHEARAQQEKARAKQLERKAQDLHRQSTQVAEAEDQQKQVRERIGGEREGLRGEIERLRETLRQNDMASSGAMERMKNVAAELERLAQRELERVEPKLANARKMSDLQDEKTWQERRASLEDRARQEELAAREAEARATKLEQRAAQAEEEGKEGTAREKARKAEEARRLREQANEQRKRAEEQRVEAERDRRDAADRPDPTRIRKELDDARRGQEEVEKSLSSLLQDLEPWSSSQEVSGEANRITREQKNLQARLEEMVEKDKDLSGKSRANLKAEQRAELDDIKDQQRRLAERTTGLLDQMKQQAQKLAKNDAESAADLKKAADSMEKTDLAGQMKSAQEKIGANKLNEARKEQREVVAQLEKLQQDLKESREARLDRLARKLRQAEQRVEELIDEQEKLQRKIQDAAKIQDPQKRQDELARLARRQKELEKKAEEEVSRISRRGNQRAAQALQQAQEEMKEAIKRLSRNHPDDEKQEDALDRLDEAQRELAQARKKTEEELGREQVARVADVLRRIRERQEGHVREAKRIQDEVSERKRWERGKLASLNNLGENQKGLAEETGAVARKDLTAAPVFARLLDRVVRDMEQSSQRITEWIPAIRQNPADVAGLPDAELLRRQTDALRRLDQLLASLKEAQDEGRPLRQNSSKAGEEGGDGDDAAGPMDNGLPPLAQLRLLRTMQQEVNERTEAFRKKHPDLKALNAAQKTQLQEIRRDQKEVGDLLARLTAPAGDEPDEGDVDAKVQPDKDAKKKGEKP